MIEARIKEIVSSATTYTFSDVNMNSFFKYSHIFENGFNFARQKWRIIHRSSKNRREESNRPITEGEFYKNTILGISSNKPVYDGYCNWIDQADYKGNYAFNQPLRNYQDYLPPKTSILIGSENIDSNDLKIASVRELLSLNTNLVNNNFCDQLQITRLIQLVEECYQVNHEKVLILEIGPGIGYWVNKTSKILKTKNYVKIYS